MLNIYFDRVLDVWAGLAVDASEEVEAQLRDDSFLIFLLFAHHGERFARAGLAVREDAHVVTCSIINQR